MFSSDRVLTLDIGSSKVMLAEFSVRESAQPVLTNCAVREMTGADASSGIWQLSGVVTELMTEMGIKPAPLLVLLSGQLVFPRTVKLSAISGDKLDEMINYEASQNLPFPIGEVVWDYHLMENEDSTGVDVMLFAVKNDVSDAVAACAEGSGLSLDLVDASYLALYNSVRYNYPELEGCTMVLDVGGRSTNLVFIDGERVFVRNISIGGSAVTREISKTMGVTEEEAEEIKRSVGFVALGGTYAVADDEQADKVSKIIRNVMTRLHSEVNRSITFYRQQGGRSPDNVLLTGGAALTRHLDTFFKEKLGVPVDYVNPFKNAAIAESVDIAPETLFLLSASVGLALRKCVKCPVEIDLIAPSVEAAHRFRRRLPFFSAAAAALVLTLLCWYSYANRLESIYSSREARVSETLKKLEKNQRELNSVRSDVAEYIEKNTYLSDIVQSRGEYVELVSEIRNALLPGMWLTGFVVNGDNLNLTVCGYEDEIVKAQNKFGGKSAAEKLVDDLIKSRFFSSEGSQVLNDSLAPPGYVREFKIRMALAFKPGFINQDGVEKSAGVGK